ncbi:MAG: hypothetical protein FJW23_11630, partial [Acidimicrobiia bacterium]|nr:hypothetical protein [Acidimicrobiia bacterium]
MREGITIQMRGLTTCLGVALVTALGALPASGQATNPAQDRPGTPNICGVPVGPPAQLPPADGGPVLYLFGPCFSAQGNVSAVEPQTYLYYMRLQPSLPSQGKWTPWNEQTEQVIREDFQRLWATNFLDDISIASDDYVFSNGVVGKIVTYHLEERERVKIIDYTGSEKVERTKIEEKLQELNISIPTDSFRDDSKIRRAESVIRSFMADKGYNDAEVAHAVEPVAGGPKLVKVTYHVAEGPKVRIREVNFVGNDSVSD